MEMYISDTKPGKLPRIPKEEWTEEKPHEVTLTVIEEGKEEKVPIKMEGGMYLEDILRWCTCKNPTIGDYVTEEDGTHGVICAKCGGVLQLG